jgi:hypothetical protein
MGFTEVIMTVDDHARRASGVEQLGHLDVEYQCLYIFPCRDKVEYPIDTQRLIVEGDRDIALPLFLFPHQPSLGTVIGVGLVRDYPHPLNPSLKATFHFARSVSVWSRVPDTEFGMCVRGRTCFAKYRRICEYYRHASSALRACILQTKPQARVYILFINYFEGRAVSSICLELFPRVSQ